MANMTRIRGVKLMTAPTPPMMPDTTRDWRLPSGMTAAASSPRASKPASSQPLGYSPRVKVTWNISHSTPSMTRGPRTLWVTTRSMASEEVRRRASPPETTPCLSRPFMKP